MLAKPLLCVAISTFRSEGVQAPRFCRIHGDALSGFVTLSEFQRRFGGTISDALFQEFHHTLIHSHQGPFVALLFGEIDGGEACITLFLSPGGGDRIHVHHHRRRRGRRSHHHRGSGSNGGGPSGGTTTKHVASGGMHRGGGNQGGDRKQGQNEARKSHG